VSDTVESDLTRLPEPKAPATLVATVMARVSRLDDARPAAIFAAAPPKRRSPAARAGHWKDVPAWVTALAGLAIVFVSWTAGRLEPSSWLGFVPSQIGTLNPVRLPPGGPAALGLGVGMLLYLAGLFAPLRKRQ
jgi:hypothetical protein